PGDPVLRHQPAVVSQGVDVGGHVHGDDIGGQPVDDRARLFAGTADTLSSDGAACAALPRASPAASREAAKIFFTFGGKDPGGYGDDRVTGDHHHRREDLPQWRFRHDVTKAHRGQGDDRPVNALGDAGKAHILHRKNERERPLDPGQRGGVIAVHRLDAVDDCHEQAAEDEHQQDLVEASARFGVTLKNDDA
nr:hypothetical protein [Tanacetum cinerariifolium]